MRLRQGRWAALAATALGALALTAAPAIAGVESGSKESHVNGFKVGKFTVQPVGSGDYTAAEVFTKSQFLRYEGDAKTNQPDRIKGDFGKYGKVDLHFHKSGPFEDQKLPNGCEGTPNKKQKGTWKGVFRLKTENAVVEVRRTELSGSIVKIGKYDCPFGPNPTYVSLLAVSENVYFNALVRKSGGKPRFLSFTGERKGGSIITRGVFARGKQPDFTYAPDYTTAELTPPAPYGGTGVYNGGVVRKKGGMSTTGTLDGNLKARFLGADDKVPISGADAQLGETGVLRADNARWSRALRSGRWHGGR